jgi:Ni/Fe-hydrogenase 1 B-type cytochrome subunit
MAHVITRQEHPLIFVITHWINLVCMAAFILSGFYIHYPFVAGLENVMRGLHFVSIWVVLINLVVRIVAAFFVKDVVDPYTGEVKADIFAFLPQKTNRHQFWPWIKYYLFMKKEVPISAKYGVLQKSAYNLVPVLILAAAFTGFSIYPVTMQFWPFSWAYQAVGGPMNMRVIHYFVMWAVIIFTMVHAYLANIYNFQPSELFFLWRQPAEVPATERGLVGTGLSTRTRAEMEAEQAKRSEPKGVAQESQ